MKMHTNCNLYLKAGFLEVLHRVIQNAIENDNDERLKAEAMQLGEGWMHINGQYSYVT